jgi:hypothetical protein
MWDDEYTWARVRVEFKLYDHVRIVYKLALGI